jgi:hypothetical protein
MSVIYSAQRFGAATVFFEESKYITLTAQCDTNGLEVYTITIVIFTSMERADSK